jgi:hypothetical protein
MENERHVGLAVVKEYFTRGIDGAIGIPGEPEGQLVVEPSRAVLALRVSGAGSAPDLAAFRNIDYEVVHDREVPWHQIAVRIDDNLDEAYTFICAVADHVQVSKQPFREAVEEVLGSLSEILSLRRALSIEQQVGLFGELLVIVALAKARDPENALDSWRGPLGEEHDFGIGLNDLETKSTISERRQHWISTATQLVPTGSRPLYLLSVQLTSATSATGRSLPGLVETIRSIDGIPVAAFDTKLHRTGYQDRDQDLYRAHWRLRTPPAFFVVDAEFPALTQQRLNEAVPSSERIVDLRYRLDLTSMESSSPLFDFESVELEDVS